MVMLSRTLPETTRSPGQRSQWVRRRRMTRNRRAQTPSTMTSPAVGEYKPTATFAAVDFPLPERCPNATLRPGSTIGDRSVTISARLGRIRSSRCAAQVARSDFA